MKLLKKILKYLFSIFIILTLIVLFIINIQGNFYKVSDDVYRSGQLNKYNLEYYIKEKNIKTILNLRGKSSKQYYLNERKIANKYNINYITYGISNSKFLDYNKTNNLVSILKNAKKPILIHCNGGADRTSLAVALYQYAILKKDYNEAKKAFSIWYGHSPMYRPKVIAMDNSFDNYVEKSIKEKKKNE